MTRLCVNSVALAQPFVFQSCCEQENNFLANRAVAQIGARPNPPRHPFIGAELLMMNIPLGRRPGKISVRPQEIDNLQCRRPAWLGEPALNFRQAGVMDSQPLGCGVERNAPFATALFHQPCELATLVCVRSHTDGIVRPVQIRCQVKSLKAQLSQ